MEQLQGLIETLHYNQTVSLPAVQIYNRTKNSVVLITAGTKSGSGFVYYAGEEAGYIVTNNHVVDNNAEIDVTFFVDGRPMVVPAKIKGKDVYSDLAVLKVDTLPEQVNPLIVGDSTQLMVGEPVYAIGNPFGLEGSITSGIVSQVGRVLRLGDLGVPEPWGSYVIADVIQFDAAVNPGNSGGPLLNGFGEVIGVTFAIETAEEVRAFIGIGYAIPSVIMKRVVDSIILKGEYVHPWMGIAYDSRYVDGLLIIDINVGGPAYNADLQINDIIVKVDELPVYRAEDLIIYLERYKSPDDTILLEVVRDGEILDEPIEFTLGSRP